MWYNLVSRFLEARRRCIPDKSIWNTGEIFLFSFTWTPYAVYYRFYDADVQTPAGVDERVLLSFLTRQQNIMPKFGSYLITVAMLSQRATLGGWVLTEWLLLVQSRQAVQSDRLGVPAPGRQRVLLPQILSLCRYYTISPASALPSASNFYWCRHYAMFACVAITIRTSDCSALRPSKIALKISTCVR